MRRHRARTAGSSTGSVGTSRWPRLLRALRLEEFLFLLLFLPSLAVTIWANLELREADIYSRKIEGGLIRLAAVVFIAGLIPFLEHWRHRVGNRAARAITEFLRTFFPFALCSAIYTNLHDTIRFVNPNDIHDKLMVIEEWLFGFQPVLWAEQFITPARTDFFSFFYTNFFVLTVVVSFVLWGLGRRREAREAMLGIILCFYMGYILYVIFPAAPPRLYYESLGLFKISLEGGAITNFQNALIEMMPNHASRAAFPSLHAGVSFVVLAYSWKFCRRLFPVLLLFVAGLIASTVYLRHHYVIDLIAGLPLVPSVLWLTPRLDRWWPGVDGAAAVDPGGPR